MITSKEFDFLSIEINPDALQTDLTLPLIDDSPIITKARHPLNNHCEISFDDRALTPDHQVITSDCLHPINNNSHPTFNTDLIFTNGPHNKTNLDFLTKPHASFNQSFAS